MQLHSGKKGKDNNDKHSELESHFLFQIDISALSWKYIEETGSRKFKELSHMKGQSHFQTHIGFFLPGLSYKKA